MPEFNAMTVTAIIVGILFTGVSIFFINAILEFIVFLLVNQKFKSDFKKAVIHSQPEWEDIKDIAHTLGIKTRVANLRIKNFRLRILKGEESELSSHRSVIEDYLSKYKIDEPFEGMPNDLRIHMERLRDRLDSKDTHLLNPLASQINELLTINEKKRKRDRLYTAGGFFVGIAGLAFALFQHFTQLTG
jgi:hypothetical protein